MFEKLQICAGNLKTDWKILNRRQIHSFVRKSKIDKMRSFAESGRLLINCGKHVVNCGIEGGKNEKCHRKKKDKIGKMRMDAECGWMCDRPG